MSAARVEADGKVKALDGKAEPDEVISEDDAKEPSKVARLFVRILKDIAILKRRFVAKRMDYEDVVLGEAGAVTQLAHKFGGRVRWMVVGWKNNAAPVVDDGLNYGSTWIRRAFFGPLTLASTAGNFTNGVRFRCTSACSITGIRFAWKAATRTVNATLWLDSTGDVLGTGSVSCTDSGIYTLTFTTPVVPALNVDMTIGIHDAAGTAYTATGTDAPFTGLLPLTLPGLSLRAVNLFIAGAARPTSSAVTELYWAEPTFGAPSPQLIEASGTDADTLALSSYAAGTATIRVEAAG